MFNKQLPAARNQLPTVYGDGVFPQLGTIVAGYDNPSGIQSVINTNMVSVGHVLSIYLAFTK